MNNFRIISTDYSSPDVPDVLLYRDRNEDGLEMVNILAIGRIDNEDDMFAIESVTFEDYKSALNFINDFSVESAIKWCKKQKIYY